MLELPGLTSSGDIGKDLDSLRRYIARLVPAVEMELINAGQDNYQAELSAQKQGVGAPNKDSTAGALVAHELRRDNPHRVTAGQLGLSLDKLVGITFLEEGAGITVRIGEKRGVQINIQDTHAEIREWTRSGGVAWAEADLGAWEEKIPILYAAVPVLRTGSTGDCWGGQLTGSGPEQIGTMRFYLSSAIDETESDTFAALRNIPMTVIGWGVFGYGDDDRTSDDTGNQ